MKDSVVLLALIIAVIFVAIVSLTGQTPTGMFVTEEELVDISEEQGEGAFEGEPPCLGLYGGELEGCCSQAFPSPEGEEGYWVLEDDGCAWRGDPQIYEGEFIEDEPFHDPEWHDPNADPEEEHWGEELPKPPGQLPFSEMEEDDDALIPYDKPEFEKQNEESPWGNIMDILFLEFRESIEETKEDKEDGEMAIKDKPFLESFWNGVNELIFGKNEGSADDVLHKGDALEIDSTKFDLGDLEAHPDQQQNGEKSIATEDKPFESFWKGIEEFIFGESEREGVEVHPGTFDSDGKKDEEPKCPPGEVLCPDMKTCAPSLGNC